MMSSKTFDPNEKYIKTKVNYVNGEVRFPTIRNSKRLSVLNLPKENSSRNFNQTRTENT